MFACRWMLDANANASFVDVVDRIFLLGCFFYCNFP